MKSAYHWLPVDDPRHTEVLGYRCTSQDGKALWASLDWHNWRLDYAHDAHLFSNARCMYFHVPVADDNEERVYRVRCWYAGGTYKRKPVVSVGIGYRDGRLHWIVRTGEAT